MSFFHFLLSIKKIQLSSKELIVDMGSPTVNSVILSSNTASLGESVTATIYASADTDRVKLVSDINTGDVVESTSYSIEGSQRVFKLSWQLKSSFYPNGGTVTAKVYAGSQSAYSNTYSTITVNVASGTKIHEAYSSPSDVNASGSSTIIVMTDTNTTSVSFSVSSGNGSLRDSRLTYYTDSNGRRRWETIFYAGSSAGNVMVNVTATPNAGASVSSFITINVKNAATDTGVRDISVKPSQIAAGTIATATITTGVDVQRVTCNNSFDQSSRDAYGGIVSGGVKTWTYDISVPQYAANQTCTVSATAYNSSAVQTDSRTTQFTVMPNVTPVDTKIHSVSVTPSTYVKTGTRVVFNITTGTDVATVSCYNDLFGEYNVASGGYVSGGTKTWSYELTVPEYWAGGTCIITIYAYDNSGLETDSSSKDLYILES